MVALFKKMSIKTKLWMMVGVSIIGLLAIFLTGKSGIDNCQIGFDAVVSHRIPMITAADTIMTDQISVQRDIREMILLKNPEIRTIINEQQVKTSKANTDKSLDFIYQNSVTDHTRALVEDVRQKLKPVNDNDAKIIKFVLNEQIDEAIAMLQQPDIYPTWLAARKAIEALIEDQNKRAQLSAQEGQKNSQQTNLWMAIIPSLAVTLLISIALLVIRAVSIAISDIVSNVKRIVGQMSFGFRLPSRHDELNDISVNLNILLESLEKAVADANSVVGALASGDFSKRICNEYVGDLDRLKVGINSSADNIANVINSLAGAMKALRDGSFSVALNTAEPGEYGQILSHVSIVMSELNAIVTDINLIMQKLSHGEFDSRVQSDAHGELASMKQTVNKSLDTLDALTNDLVRVADAEVNGDLTMSASGQYHGRFATLQTARAQSTEKLRTVIDQVLATTQMVSGASTQVAQGSLDLSARIQQQAAALEQTSATMNQMTSAVQANTANAQRAADLTHDVQKQAQDGMSTMEETIGAMQSIKLSSSKIADIVTLIDSIAFQTNLLALNAAVEAARAGEHGRGFAVVASEVRALAGKSADAAKDIKVLINDSVEKIDNGTQLADQSGVMLESILGSIEQVTGVVEQIAHSSHEQSMGINQLNIAIADIDRVMQENAALVEETTASAESLSEEAKGLRDNMGFFKTGSRLVSHATDGRRQGIQVIQKAALPKLPVTPAGTDDAWNEF